MSFVSLQLFKKIIGQRKTSLRRFLTRLEKQPPRHLDKLTALIEPEVWKEVQCLKCANCCREMTPTYNAKDIRRISRHLGMTDAEFKKKWLRRERGTGDWLNRSTPCQFLDLKTNMCSIYEVRPADCAGFPHLPKKKMVEYMHVHKQNLEYCPASHAMVEKIMERLS